MVEASKEADGVVQSGERKEGVREASKEAGVSGLVPPFLQSIRPHLGAFFVICLRLGLVVACFYGQSRIGRVGSFMARVVRPSHFRYSSLSPLLLGGD